MKLSAPGGWHPISGVGGTTTLLALALAQLLTSVVGIDATSPAVHPVRTLPDGLPHNRLNCMLSRCSGHSGRALEDCAKRCRESGLVTTRSAACSFAKCEHYSGLYRDLCIFTNCELAKAEGRLSSGNSVPPAAKRYYDYDAIMWPDEFETRSSNEQNRPKPRDLSRSSRMPSPEPSLVRMRKDAEMDLPVESQGCSSICDAFTGDQYKECRRTKCKDTTTKPIQIKKRWSTRLCMEAHCQGVGSKVDYFMCGKMHCH